MFNDFRKERHSNYEMDIGEKRRNIIDNLNEKNNIIDLDTKLIDKQKIDMKAERKKFMITFDKEP